SPGTAGTGGPAGRGYGGGGAPDAGGSAPLDGRGKIRRAGNGSGDIFLGLRYTGKDRKSTRLNSSHVSISYAVFCLKKKNRGLDFLALVFKWRHKVNSKQR